MLLRPRDAARQLNVSYPTIKNWIYADKIEAVKTAGGHYRIPQSAVDKLLEVSEQPLEEVESADLSIGRVSSLKTNGVTVEVTVRSGEKRFTSILAQRECLELGLVEGMTIAVLPRPS